MWIISHKTQATHSGQICIAILKSGPLAGIRGLGDDHKQAIEDLVGKVTRVLNPAGFQRGC